jgi:hypothetical protein
MSEFDAILQRYTEKLIRACALHCFDGTEVHGTIDRELCGLEHGVTATNIKRAIEAKYRDSIPGDVVIEIVSKLREEGLG